MRAEKWTRTQGAYEVEVTNTIPETAADVTEEILDLARMYVEGWYDEGPIDWEDVWNRMDGSTLADGTELSMGEDADSPAMRKVQRVIREERR